MKAITFDATLPKYITTAILGKINRNLYYNSSLCLSMKDIDEPKLPNENWVKIKTLYGGICGSDLNLILMHDSPSTSPFVSFPFVIGHENLGIITEKGKNVDGFEVGDKVTVDPLLSCETRGIDNVCPNCKNGHYSLCENMTAPPISPGISIGFCKDTGGSWGEYYVAHKSHLYKVPDGVTDSEAILIDPICSALHPVINNFPDDNEKVLVVGSGVIGLLIIACIRALGSNCEITAICKYSFQSDMAKKFGANNIVYSRDIDYFDKLEEITNAKLYKPIIGKRFMIGGFDKVYDCVGSSITIDESLKFTTAKGTMVLVGLASFPKRVDWTPIWFKEINITGSMYYNTETTPNGNKQTAYDIAFGLIKNKKLDVGNLLTHTYPIDNYKQAIHTAIEKNKNKSFKVAFKF
jgi:threonine dehydrogenase-like Zn-dependent dehydrogenase